MSRRALVAGIVRELRSGPTQGVFVVGRHGVGKTWVVGQVLAELGAETTVIRLAPSGALSSVPYGAVNARIGAAGVPHDDFYGVLSALEVQIRTSQSDFPVLLVVDNAGYLDTQSAAVIAQALIDTGAKLILVDHPGAAGDALHQLWRDGGLSRFEVESMVTGEVQGLMEELLEGKVAGAAASYLFQRSNGNAAVLKGLVAGALEHSTLREVDGIWNLDHPADHLGAESRDFLRMDLSALSPASRRIVDILALAGPLPLDAVLQLCTADELDQVQQSEIAAITLGRVVNVELARPAYGATIRELVPVGRRRSLRAEVSAVFDPYALDLRDSIVADVLWQVDSGLAIDDGLLVDAARLANWAMLTQEALHISRLVTRGVHLGPAQAQQSIASYHSSDVVSAQTLATSALSLASGAEEAAEALEAWFLAYAPTSDFGERFARQLMDFHSTFGDTGPDGDASSPGFRVEVLRAQCELSLGDLVAAQDRLCALLANPTLEDLGTNAKLKGMLCEVFAGLGRVAEAAALAAEVLVALDVEPFPRPDISVLAYARASAAMIYYGDWATATRLLEDAGLVHHTLILPSRGLRHLGLAMMYTRMGWIDLAVAQMRPCLDALTEHDPWLVRPTALGMGAYVFAMRADGAQARTMLEQFDHLGSRGNALFSLEGQAYAAAARAIIGEAASGIAVLRDIRMLCQSRGYATAELTVSMLLLRVGDADALGRMQELAQVVQSRHSEFYIAYGEALATQKGELLQEASASAASHGFDLLAAELAAMAQERFHARGQEQKSRKAAVLLQSLRDRLPGIVSPVFGSVDQPELTRREVEIAKFVVTGRSNNEISQHLHVSVRTVEGHLYRMFIKLGINSRDELTRMTRGLVGAATIE